MTHLTGFPWPLVRRGSRRGAGRHKRAATQPAAKGSRPPVGLRGPPDALRLLPDAGASRREPRLPGEPRSPIKWVIINGPWYKMPRRGSHCLRVQECFVWNATDLSRRVRGGLVDLLADYGARVRIVYLEVPPAGQRQRNAARRSPVPEAAIDRMLKNWEPPGGSEAYRVDWICITN